MGQLKGILGLAIVALLAPAAARALDPSRSVAQYKHTRWTVDDGAPVPLSVIAQGNDGYLWVAGLNGLYRFDGLEFEYIAPRQPTKPGTSISAMLVSRRGDVWVGYSTGGTAVYRNGVLNDVPMPAGDYVMGLAEAPDGSLWATLGRKAKQLFRFRNGHWAEVGTGLGFPEAHLAMMVAARDGTLWITTTDQGLLVLRPGARRFVRSRDAVSRRTSISEDRKGRIWLTDKFGSRIARGTETEENVSQAIPYPTPEARRKTHAVMDRDGNLWGMMDKGIFRVRQPSPTGASSRAVAAASVTEFGVKDGLTSDALRSILEDREGNIWVSSSLGLDRFRAANVVVEPALTKRAYWYDVLLGASDGTVYVGESDAVYRIAPGGSPQVILRAPEPQAICEGADGAVWIVLQGQIVRMQGKQSSSFAGPGKTDQGISDCAVDKQNEIWLAAIRDGLFRRIDGAWRQSMVPPPLGGFPPTSLLRGRDGQILVAFEENSLARLNPPQAPQFLINPRSDLGKIRTMIERPGRLLIGGPFGIGEIKQGRIRYISSERVPALRDISGLVQTSTGQTWASTSGGPVVMSSAALDRALADPKAPLAVRTLDFRDGLPGLPSRDSIRSVVQGRDGRLWFSIATGTVWVDPNRLARNDVVPPVKISAIKAGEVTVRDPTTVSLKAGTTSLQISFAALSLSIPERVKVRYSLSGDSQGWVDPGMRRQAFYTNLGPGHYVFRVIAANNDGVWNRTGAKLEFYIPPTFLQSNWFIALCGAAAGLLLWVAYRVRVRQLTGKMRERLEERLAERERIARDLHDTLLQGFQGLILRFQSVANEIPENLRAHGLIGQALDSADKVLSDGRNSVKQLRTVGHADVARALSEAAERMRISYPVEFKMVVEGVPRALHPLVRDEISRIGEEAIINAFQHARASLIELALSYEASGLTLGVRDNGIGIDPDILERGGRQGHFGLVGMRERAQQIDAELTVSSRPGSGTEMRVTVAGKIAYAAKGNSSWRQWFGLTPIADGGI